MRAVYLIITLTLSACAQFPELDKTIPASAEAADYPELVPLEPLLAASVPDGVDQEETTRQLEARAAALRARAVAQQQDDTSGQFDPDLQKDADS